MRNSAKNKDKRTSELNRRLRKESKILNLRNRADWAVQFYANKQPKTTNRRCAWRNRCETVDKFN